MPERGVRAAGTAPRSPDPDGQPRLLALHRASLRLDEPDRERHPVPALTPRRGRDGDAALVAHRGDDERPLRAAEPT